MAPLLARRPAADRAFERLYRRHSGDVYRYALALLRDPNDAEDATQTAFMNAYRALVRGEQPNSPRAWLLAIVHNVCRMRRRSLARRPREVPIDEHPLPAVEDERPRLDVVLAALAELPLNQRAALVMREIEGRSYSEIAGVLGVTTSAVEALIFRARQRLRVKREALGAIAVAPVPASLGVFPGVVTTAIGTDLIVKAAAGVAAALLAGGAAYQAATGTAKGAPDGARTTAPRARRVLLANERPGAKATKARVQRHAKTRTARKRTARAATSAGRTSPQPVTSTSKARHIVAPVATRPISTPPSHAAQTAQPAQSTSSTLPPLPVPQPPPAQVPTVTVPQLPAVTVPSVPPPPTVPDPPPLPKIP